MCQQCYTKTYNQSRLKEHAEYERKRRAEKSEGYQASEKRRSQSDGRRQWKQKYHQEYYTQNRDRLLEYQRQYRRDDPERRDNYKRRRRARVLGLPDTLTVMEWHTILEQHNHTCFYCGTSNGPFHREHKIPASKGGGYTAENIVPACATCNLRKQAMNDEEFREYLQKYPR